MKEMQFNSEEGQKIFPLAKMPILPVRPTQQPTQWVLGAVFLEMKPLGHDAAYLPWSSAEVDGWSYTSIPIHHCGMRSDFIFTFISHEHSPVTNCRQPHLIQFWNYRNLQKIMIKNTEIIQCLPHFSLNERTLRQHDRGIQAHPPPNYIRPDLRNLVLHTLYHKVIYIISIDLFTVPKTA